MQISIQMPPPPWNMKQKNHVIFIILRWFLFDLCAAITYTDTHSLILNAKLYTLHLHSHKDFHRDVSETSTDIVFDFN